MTSGCRLAFLAFIWLASQGITIAEFYDFDRLVPDFLNLFITSNAVQEISDSICNEAKDFQFISGEPTSSNIFFQLRTPCSSVDATMQNAKRLRHLPQFDSKKKVVAFTTGWNASPKETYVKDLEKAYQCRGSYNFLAIDASRFLNSINYGEAARHVVAIGKALAHGLVNLGVPAENIHLIGHSLGAHVVGSAGHYYAKLTGNKIDRITGLDPAKPCFNSIRMLSAADANFVDVIHSNPHVWATEEAIGHADFYPIGLSPSHPSCTLPLNMCSHSLAVAYFTKTVYPGNEMAFLADHCDEDWQLFWRLCAGRRIPMGFAASHNARGLFKGIAESKHPDKVEVRKNCGLCSRQSPYMFVRPAKNFFI